MGYLKRITFKTGVSPQLIRNYNMNSLTTRQKLELSSARIFGTIMNGNKPSGRKQMKKQIKGPRMIEQFHIPNWDMSHIWHGIVDMEKVRRERKLQHDRQMRIMMRGVKIGRKVGGGKVNIMSVFEKDK